MEARRAIAEIFRRTASGTRHNTKKPGYFMPAHTRGHAAELRTLVRWSARRSVATITAVPSSSAGRTPDFVVTFKNGWKTRLEVTTVTGARRGYQPRGIGGPIRRRPARSRTPCAARPARTAS